ncbi:hypothetical protein [Tsukamurella ocularis]|uniref:hypothetical protein n=1 Tax=Tsukamurella ocularis TaxID=1970234 RepID=UPI002168E0AC|nr:hypothetical protein [Tsukamurella ocularis]MCS3779407.1 hypothetical protein [Tsukamurella ocularis]MCS3789863.1 hypothetical protein [Tsukamurella ocularis]
MTSRTNSGMGQVGPTRAERREQAARVSENGPGNQVSNETGDDSGTNPAPTDSAAAIDGQTGGAGEIAPDQKSDVPRGREVVSPTPLSTTASLQALASTFRSEKPAKEQWGTQLPSPLTRRINLARRILNVPLTDLAERVFTEWLDANGLPHADENGDAVPMA